MSNKVSENLHVILWLFKDMCWCMSAKIGMVLIPPTVFVAFYIFYKNRKERDSAFHNMAVCFWIVANSIWMIADLLKKEAAIKPYSIALFIIGLLILAYYYSILLYKKSKCLNIEKVGESGGMD